MLEESHEQPTYSTGELAQACGVSVRTVQFYDELPAESISGMEDIMQNDKNYEKQLQSVYHTMLGVAIPVGILELGALAHWIRKGDWKPFLGVELLALPLAFGLVRFYRERVAYLCPHCHEVFQPDTREWFFAGHTPTTRKVTCTHCKTTDWCTEVAAARMSESAASAEPAPAAAAAAAAPAAAAN